MVRAESMLLDMTATSRSVALMILGPPLILFCWAHFIRPVMSGLDLFVYVLAGIVGLAGAASAPWSIKAKGAVAVLYICIFVATLPFIGLLAVCSTGDCI